MLERANMDGKLFCNQVDRREIFFITLSASNIENPPTKRADADPEIFLAPLNETLIETDISCLMSFDLGIASARCSGV